MPDYSQLKHLIVTVDDGVATVTLNRPETLNAMNRELLQNSIPSLWPMLQKDRAVRVVILTGAGDRAFSSGLDVKEAAGPAPVQYGRAGSGNLQLTPRAFKFTKPFITALNGLCGGVALAFVSDADIAIAAESAYLFNPGVTIGQLATYAPLTWTRWVPFQSVMRMLLVGNRERITAQQAKELGMVTEVVPADRLMDRAREIAAMIAYNSPSAVRHVKRIMWEALDVGLNEAHANGQAIMREYAGHPDLLEGPRALVEKRTPNWAEIDD